MHVLGGEPGNEATCNQDFLKGSLFFGGNILNVYIHTPGSQNLRLWSLCLVLACQGPVCLWFSASEDIEYA